MCQHVVVFSCMIIDNIDLKSEHGYSVSLTRHPLPPEEKKKRSPPHHANERETCGTFKHNLHPRPTSFGTEVSSIRGSYCVVSVDSHLLLCITTLSRREIRVQISETPLPKNLVFNPIVHSQAQTATTDVANTSVLIVTIHMLHRLPFFCPN